MEQPTSAAKKPPATQRIVLIAVIVIVPIMVLILRYRSHLTWKVMEHRLELRDVYEAPTQIMPPAVVPGPWRVYKAAGLKLSLPSDMTEQPIEQVEAILFQNQELKILVFPRQKMSSSEQEFLQKAEEFSPTKAKFTSPRLRYEIYQKNVDDFRWSMTNEEVLWHFYCMNVRSDQPGQKVEGFFADDIDGLLVIQNETASFDWQSKSKPYKGSLQFVAQQGELDLETVRAICQSVVLDNGD